MCLHFSDSLYIYVWIRATLPLLWAFFFFLSFIFVYLFASWLSCEWVYAMHVYIFIRIRSIRLKSFYIFSLPASLSVCCSMHFGSLRCLFSFGYLLLLCFSFRCFFFRTIISICVLLVVWLRLKYINTHAHTHIGMVIKYGLRSRSFHFVIFFFFFFLLECGSFYLLFFFCCPLNSWAPVSFLLKFLSCFQSRNHTTMHRKATTYRRHTEKYK